MPQVMYIICACVCFYDARASQTFRFSNGTRSLRYKTRNIEMKCRRAESARTCKTGGTRVGSSQNERRPIRRLVGGTRSFFRDGKSQGVNVTRVAFGVTSPSGFETFSTRTQRYLVVCSTFRLQHAFSVFKDQHRRHYRRRRISRCTVTVNSLAKTGFYVIS